ncbi:MAG: Polyprenyl synthetase [Frankiales bacterium]|nr:Polyprenyl synthetase [Frankiales bacterium]
MSVLDRNDLRSRVQLALDAFLDAHEPSLLAMADELAPLADEVRAFLSGGKRLRPGFCFWGHLGAGGKDSDDLVRAAASLELFQAAAIIHDDVMDGSDTRRGRPAVHRRFAAMHGEQFGTGAAILLGDLCLSWSDEMLVGSGLLTEQSRAVFDTMRAELMAGQYLDLLEQATGGGTVESALRVARYKSAKYTIVEPLHLGATTAAAGPEVLEAYSAYGLPLGIAFQLRDDLLGVFGDPAVTGKPAGDDLREGKRTVLVATALRSATGAQAEVVRTRLGDPGLDADGVAALQQVLVETGAVDEVEARITSSTEEALAALDDRVAGEAREALRDLAIEATVRQT